jgi:hypothetical protein
VKGNSRRGISQGPEQERERDTSDRENETGREIKGRESERINGGVMEEREGRFRERKT